LTAGPWSWLGDQIRNLGAGPRRDPWPLAPEDAAELPGLADEIVSLAQRFSPVRCTSAADCYRLTNDVRGAVRLMVEYLEQPALLDRARVSPWLATP
jgi:hypothetical protein